MVTFSQRIKWRSLEKAALFAHKSLKKGFARDFINELIPEHREIFFIEDFLIYEMNFYGIHPPSTIYELIPLELLTQNPGMRGLFSGGKLGDFIKEESGYSFYPTTKKSPSYISLMVEAKQLKKYIKKRKSEYENIPKELKLDSISIGFTSPY